jgi:hypothetical protein
LTELCHRKEIEEENSGSNFCEQVRISHFCSFLEKQIFGVKDDVSKKFEHLHTVLHFDLVIKAVQH